MENRSFWQRNVILSKLSQIRSRSKENRYIRKPSNLKGLVSIDIDQPISKNYASPRQTAPKRRIKDPCNTSHHYEQLKNFLSVQNSKDGLQAQNEEENPRAEYNTILKSRVPRGDNTRLPNIKEDKPPSANKQRPPRNKHYSVDYGYRQDKNANNPDSSYCNQPASDQVPQVIKNETKVVASDRIIKKPMINPKESSNKSVSYRYADTKDEVEPPDSYLTLTSAFGSRVSLRDSLDEILKSQHNADMVIRDIVERNVEMAYKNIDLIKKNFQKKDKKYWFQVSKEIKPRKNRRVSPHS